MQTFVLRGKCFREFNPDLDSESFTLKVQKRIFVSLNEQSAKKIIEIFNDLQQKSPLWGVNLPITVYGRKNLSHLFEEKDYNVTLKKWKSNKKSGFKVVLI